MRPPSQIYLQWYGDYDPEFLSEPEKDRIDPHTGEVSWWLEPIFPSDLIYISKEVAEQREELLRQQILNLEKLVVSLRGSAVNPEEDHY